MRDTTPTVMDGYKLTVTEPLAAEMQLDVASVLPAGMRLLSDTFALEHVNPLNERPALRTRRTWSCRRM
ncbi:MAG: hypothetical protein ACRDRH_29990 [Pseudonocardia sp.]